jgi:hypothetical protein
VYQEKERGGIQAWWDARVSGELSDPDGQTQFIPTVECGEKPKDGLEGFVVEVSVGPG